MSTRDEEMHNKHLACLSTKGGGPSGETSPAATTGQMLSSLETILSVSIPGSESSSPLQGSISCLQAFSLPYQLAPSDLAGAVLAEVVSRQIPAIGVSYLVSCYTQYKAEENHCRKRGTAKPISTILTSTRYQIVSTLSNVLRGVWSGPPSTSSSPLYPLISEENFPTDLLEDMVTLLAPDSAALNKVFSPLLQQSLSESRRRRIESKVCMAPLLSLIRLTNVQLGSGCRPIVDLLVTQPQWFPADITRAKGLEIEELTFLGRT